MTTEKQLEGINWAINQMMAHKLVCVKRSLGSFIRYDVAEASDVFKNEEVVAWEEVRQCREAMLVVMQAAMDDELGE